MAYGQESFSIERVAATLQPFDMAGAGGGGGGGGKNRMPNLIQLGTAVANGQVGNLFTTLLGNQVSRLTGGLIQIGGRSGGGGGSNGTPNAPETPNITNATPLYPIYQTGGLVFPYNPIISEGVSVRYDNVEVVHSNESYHAYRSTDNVRIELSNCVWTCDTFENARYALAALHFFRSYSLMDFGQKRSGRPPSPMWFSAYGNYAYHRVPVLLERAQWSFPNDVDYVGIPEPHTNEWAAQQLATNRSGPNSQKYTWLPVRFEVASITLIVQHAPKYWLSFSLNDYKTGEMLNNRGSFHLAGSTGGSIGIGFPNAGSSSAPQPVSPGQGGSPPPPPPSGPIAPGRSI